MTDEELKQTMKEVAEGIAGLSADESALTRDEQRRKRWLQQRQLVLEGIKEAKEKGKHSVEMRRTIEYSLINSYGEKHPFITYLMLMRVRGNVLF